MTTYQELVERVLAVRHAGTEMGLCRAREQKGFVLNVSALLDKTSWDYTPRMDGHFAVTFCVEWGLIDFEHQITAVQQALAAVYDVHRNGDVLTVEDERSGYACRVVFGDVPQ